MYYEHSFKLATIKLAGLVNQAFLNDEQAQNYKRPLLIFVHGFLDNAASFSTVLPMFSEYSCIAIDLPGHGHSDHRSVDAHYHLSDYAYDLHCLISSLNYDKVVLIGHSLGAIVSSIYASTQPVSLKGFVAIESIGPLTEPPETTSAQIKASFLSRDRAHKPIKHPENMAMIIRSRCAISDLTVDQAQIILSRNTELTATGTLIWRTDKRLRTKSSMRMTEQQALNILQSISCKRSVIIGSKGFDKIKRIINKRKAMFENVMIDECEGGHHVHMCSPKEVASKITQHLDSFLK